MSRYIDADELVIDYYDDYETKDDVYTYAYVSQFQIDSAPSIDIVRCKECIDNSINCDGDENWCLRFGYDVEPSGFCSYGERREP